MGAIVTVVVAFGIVAAAESSRSALDRYYAAIPVASFDEFTPYAELRDPLVASGRPMIVALVEDLRSPDVSIENRRKALFALGAFYEAGAIDCEGIVIPALIELLDIPDDELAAWSEVVLAEPRDLALSDARAWSEWWQTEGRERFAERCDSRPDAGETVDHTMTYFYENPSAARFAEFQRRVAAGYDELFAGNARFATLVSVFLGKVHEKWGWPLLDVGDLDDRARAIADRDRSDWSRYVWDDTRVDPGKLDVWWVSFFATGETAYLDRVIGQIGDPETRSDRAQILVAGAATWSLAANGRQHPAVLDHAKTVLRRDPADVDHETLREIVEQAERRGH